MATVPVRDNVLRRVWRTLSGAAAQEQTAHLDLRLDELHQATRDVVELLRATEARTRTLEHELGRLKASAAESADMLRETVQGMRDMLTLVRITEERSRSQEYEGRQTHYACEQLLDSVHRLYVEAPVSRDALDRVAAAAAAIRLETGHPLAVTSQDHQEPDSTQEGIARPSDFVVHCAEVVGRDTAWLDIGCGAAGLVYEAAMQGLVAFGLDGSDHCRRNRIGYWPLLPRNLRTCDVTEPFSFIAESGDRVQFGLISAWEVLEHISEERLDGLLSNVRGNLAAGGYFVGSISLLEYDSPSGIPYHVTLKPREWWREKFARRGLTMIDNGPFDTRLFPRGNGPRFQDFHNYRLRPDEGFHFVAAASEKARP